MKQNINISLSNKFILSVLIKYYALVHFKALILIDIMTNTTYRTLIKEFLLDRICLKHHTRLFPIMHNKA